MKLYEIIETPKQLYMIMELLNGKPLNSYVYSKRSKRLIEKEALRIFTQVLSGIDYCHSLNITHRDIKMDNIYLDENLTAKILDFGFSICAGPTQKLKIFCGTPSYMAPEIINKIEYLGPPADIWSLGILLYVMVVGKFPFRASTDRDLFRSISKGNFLYPPFVSTNLKTLINSMLNMDPEKRITSDAIIFI